jgi:hypothetical protein
MNTGFFSLTRSLVRPAHQAAKQSTAYSLQNFELEKDYYVQGQEKTIEIVQFTQEETAVQTHTEMATVGP